MVPAECTPDYLQQLGVTVTQLSPVDPSIDVFQEFLAAAPTKRVKRLFVFKYARFLYMSELKEFVAASMVLKPHSQVHKETWSRDYQEVWVIAQLGNTLALGASPILFQVKDLQSIVLVPMNKVDAVALKLEYNPLPLTKDNCPLPPSLVNTENSFFKPEKVITALPTVLAVGHGGVLPEDLWDALMMSLVDTDKAKSITGGKEQHKIVAAYHTLRSNGYQSYLYTDKIKLGVKYKALSQKISYRVNALFSPQHMSQDSYLSPCNG